MTIKELRSAAGMTQQEFSEYFEIPKRTIENWEGSQRNAPDYLIKLIEYKLLKEGKIMTYEELKSKGIKIQDHDRYDGDVYLGNREFYILNSSLYVHEYNNNLNQYAGKENNTEWLSDVKENYSDAYWFSLGLDDKAIELIGEYLKEN